MAWARLITYPGGTEEQYRAVVDEVGDAHANAPGRLFLTAGPSERGWQISQEKPVKKSAPRKRRTRNSSLRKAAGAH